MTEERFWLLLSLKLSGEATPQELAELETCIQEFPEKSYQADKMDILWQSKHTSPGIEKEAAFNKHMQRLSNHFSEPVLQFETAEINGVHEERNSYPLYKKIAWITGIAASLLLVWFLGFNSPALPKPDNSKAQNTITTKRGNKSNIRLPDGTEVWLNADSKITYNENFQGDIREVTLSGEAFFDVVKDRDRPFVIHTDVIDIKVLGTAFNVRSYADEKITEASLIRGSVEVTLRSNQKKYTLEPNDKLVIDHPVIVNDPGIAVRKKEKATTELAKLVKVKFEEKEKSASETLWTRGKLAFDEEPMEEIALMLERWYDVKVNVDDRVRKEQYSGVFEDEGLEQVLRALKLSDHGFNYTINKKEVTIRP